MKAAAHYVLDYGSAEQKRRWLPRCATGELVCAYALTEPGSGSDAAAMKTVAGTARSMGIEVIG